MIDGFNFCLYLSHLKLNERNDARVVNCGVIWMLTEKQFIADKMRNFACLLKHKYVFFYDNNSLDSFYAIVKESTVCDTMDCIQK